MPCQHYSRARRLQVLHRLAEILDHFTTGTRVHDGSTIDVTADFVAPAMTTSIWDLE